ncbi:hypothetical protein EON67_03560 [archaeon]|nr:MAG: hypothetical protein EON67_03560 [archaeon]
MYSAVYVQPVAIGLTMNGIRVTFTTEELQQVLRNMLSVTGTLVLPDECRDMAVLAMCNRPLLRTMVVETSFDMTPAGSHLVRRRLRMPSARPQCVSLTVRALHVCA